MTSLPAYFNRVFIEGRKVYLSLKVTFPRLLGLASAPREPTEEYPDRVSARMPEDLPPRFRGMLTNDIQKCSGCRYCADVCPVDCIHIETERGPDKNVSWVSVFDIDHSRCMFCGLCVETCPTQSLQHSREYQGASYQLMDMVHSFGRGWATSEMKELWRKEQQIKEAKSEESARLMTAPISSELKKREKQKQEKKSFPMNREGVLQSWGKSLLLKKP